MAVKSFKTLAVRSCRRFVVPPLPDRSGGDDQLHRRRRSSMPKCQIRHGQFKQASQASRSINSYRHACSLQMTRSLTRSFANIYKRADSVEILKEKYCFYFGSFCPSVYLSVSLPLFQSLRHTKLFIPNLLSRQTDG
jgi:hypothetical protein